MCRLEPQEAPQPAAQDFGRREERGEGGALWVGSGWMDEGETRGKLKTSSTPPIGLIQHPPRLSAALPVPPLASARRFILLPPSHALCPPEASSYRVESRGAHLQVQAEEGAGGLGEEGERPREAVRVCVFVESVGFMHTSTHPPTHPSIHPPTHPFNQPHRHAPQDEVDPHGGQVGMRGPKQEAGRAEAGAAPADEGGGPVEPGGGRGAGVLWKGEGRLVD